MLRTEPRKTRKTLGALAESGGRPQRRQQGAPSLCLRGAMGPSTEQRNLFGRGALSLIQLAMDLCEYRPPVVEACVMRRDYISEHSGLNRTCSVATGSGSQLAWLPMEPSLRLQHSPFHCALLVTGTWYLCRAPQVTAI